MYLQRARDMFHLSSSEFSLYWLAVGAGGDSCTALLNSHVKYLHTVYQPLSALKKKELFCLAR